MPLMSFRTSTQQAPPRTRSVSLPRRSSNSTFCATAILVYAAATLAATLALNPYFSQTWDVQTFIQAARELLSAHPLDLYARSRAAQTWPYAYPPLYAGVVALALVGGDAARALVNVPDYLWARVPALVADIGVALLLRRMVGRKTNDAVSARTVMLVWLFNPVTFYNTAVQGHFESAWLFFVLLAYRWLEEARGIVLPTLALAIAVMFKQVAILYALPVWVALLLRAPQSCDSRFPIASLRVSVRSRSLRAMTQSAILFALVTAAVSLPFLLYSDDYVYMNLTYVENVPVQTVSWLVGILGLTRAAPDALTTDFFLIRYQTWITLGVVTVIALIAARRAWGLWLTGTLVTLAFFLLSKKVMGYYYVMLLPFLFAEFLPRRRYDLALAAIGVTAFSALLPYYAAWTNHAHWWVYAGLGVLQSLVLVGLLMVVARAAEPLTMTQSSPAPIRANPRPVIFVALACFGAAVFAALLQPLVASAASPIRAPLVAPGGETLAGLAFGAHIALTLGAGALIARATRGLGELARRDLVVPLVFAPLAFAVYTLTKESTAVLETVLKALGV